MLEYLKERFSEASTWRGIIAVVTGLGVKVSPELAESIIAMGLALMGLLGIVTKDKAAPSA